MFLLVVPGGLQWQLRRGPRDGLVALRQVTLAFSVMIALIGVVLPFIQAKDDDAWPWVIALVVVACASVVVSHVTERPLDCTSPTTLASTYRSRFFLRVAFAESVSLCAFVFVFLGAGMWIYLPGAAFALIRIWTTAAPTRSALAAEQNVLTARRCGLSLVAALRSVPSNDAR